MATPGSKAHRRHRRRAAIRRSLFTRGPVRLSRGRLARPKPGRDFKLTGASVKLPALPDALAGFSIAHLSDPHVGDLLTADHLPAIVDATNAIGADLIAVTGDFIDFSNDVLPDVIDAMQQLRAPHGAWFVLGNHDYLDNADEVKAAFAEADLNLLLNEAAHVDYAGHRIAIGGIDWAHTAAHLRRDVEAAASAMETNTADLSLLLAHHPHAFDTARTLGVDLTLSGHTHGGQFLISKKRGKKGSIGLANLAFRYTKGLYEHAGSHLHVTTGVGSWFPWRFRCPAEITRIELSNSA